MNNSDRPLIFIDTCSLLESCWIRKGSRDNESFEYSKAKDETFWSKELEGLVAMGEVIIPKRNYDELVKHSKNTKKADLSSRASHVLQRINSLYSANKISVVGDKNDPFADAILLSVALKFKTQKNMCFITQDRSLSEDLEAIRHFKSVDNRAGYDIKIRRISKDGSLEPHKGLSRDASYARRYGHNRSHNQNYNQDQNHKPSAAATTKTTKKGWWES